MIAERWKRVEELYHAANALPIDERAAFLDEACGGDTALRREVASLLDEATATGVLDGPALVGPDVLSHLTDRAPFIGRTLGGYRLDALLGAGGMGEVYRGFDLKLGRDVAIKILPEAFTRDADRLARFEREARMLAALNHPHICAIYGFEEAEGIRFLILELVPVKRWRSSLPAAAPCLGGMLRRSCCRLPRRLKRHMTKASFIAI